MIIAYILLRKVSFGSKVLAVGGNSQAATYSGINVPKIRLMVMVLSGVMSVSYTHLDVYKRQELPFQQDT